MHRHRLLAAALAASAALLPTALPSAAHAADDQAASKGRFTIPFREDKAPYDPATNTFGGPRGDKGCLPPPDGSTHNDCLPAGATESVLADGRILYWNALEGTEDIGSPTQAVLPNGGDLAQNDLSRVMTLNWSTLAGTNWAKPGTGYFPTQTEPPLLGGVPGQDNPNPDPTPSSGSLFCSDQKQLADGTILAAGGTDYYAEPRLNPTTGVIELEGVRNARIFDPATNTWQATAPMNYGRWYPSMVTLQNGKVFIASGVTKLIKPVYPTHVTDSGDNVKQTETYDPAAKAWAYNGTSADRSLPLFPRLHLLPDGHVFYDAAGQAFNPMGQSYNEALWNVAASYDPAGKSWTDLGVPGLDNPATTNGDYAEPGFRGSTFDQALPYQPDAGGNYSSATFITAGGVQLMSPGSYLPTDTTRLTTVTVGSDGKEAMSSVPADKLGRRRWFSTGVTLPTGQVLAFSGADVDEVVSPGSESPIRQAELFTPDVKDGKYVGGRWDDMAVASRKRTYHNNAILLPDGRVLVGGHAPIPNSYYYTHDNPDTPVRTASNNFHDASFEVYEPPYLHWGVARPVIDPMNPAVITGRQLVIPTHDKDSIDSVVLVRNPSQTHVVDADQRVVSLPFSKDNSGDALIAQVPSNTAVLPPGPYMLFINKHADKGQVPSVATQVFVDTAVPGWARSKTYWPTPAADGTSAAYAPAPGDAAAAVVSLPAAPSASTSATARRSALSTRPATRPNVAVPLNAAPAGSSRDADRPRGLALFAIGLFAVLAAGSAAAGFRRRRPVRITE